MDKKYDSCSYKARRTFLGGEFEVRLFEVDDVGVAAVVFQMAQDNGQPLKFWRVFSRTELDNAGIARTLEGHVALVDSLELVKMPISPATTRSRVPEENNLLVNLVVKGLTALCREKPPGLEAVKWLGNWFLDHNPAQPKVEVED
eukprot:jgi/Phyca11/526423/estExt2_fgenesh1_pm.C_PHYCAscaffold_90165